MKTVKVISFGLAPLLAGVGFSVLAASPPIYGTSPSQLQPQRPPGGAVLVSQCPSGWVKTGTLASGGFKCSPQTPPPLNCPPGTYYSKQGCDIGCWPEIK